MKETDDPQLGSLSQPPICGIVMPISELDGCSTEHWLEVQEIIKSVIIESELHPNLVSDSDDVGVIQGRIVQNLYNYPIIICDVSGKNPNVMFELGIRLAFDKPTIIIKDDKTDYSFDTSPIEHISYPRDLRFNKIVLFKEKLKGKIEGTLKKSSQDQNYSPFLKHFGEFIVPKLDQKEVGFNEFVINSLNGIKDEMANLKRRDTKQKVNHPKYYNTIEEKEQFMKIYLKTLYNNKDTDTKTREGLKDKTYQYFDSWNSMGYSNEEVQDLFEKCLPSIIQN